MNKILDQLKNKIIPFWLNLKDEKHGGFYGFVDNDLNIEKTANKSLISQTRHLYSFSLWYEYFKEEELKLAAEHCYKFLLEAFFDDEYGGFYWLVGFDKKPVNTLKNVYGQAFAIYGLSEYGRVFQNEEAILLAYDLFLLIDKYAYRSECCYIEQFSRKWEEDGKTLVAPENTKFLYTTNTLLHLLEAYTNLYKVYENRLLKMRIIELMNIFKKRLFDENKGTFYLYFDESKNLIKQGQSFGHDIEACWLIDESMKVLKIDDRVMKEITLLVANSVYENGLTNRGLITEINGNDVDERIWWVQVEAMVGFYNHYKKTNDSKYLTAVKSIYDFINNVLIDKRANSEWFWGVDKDNKPLEMHGIAENWKASYHNGRAFIQLLKRGCKL